MGTRKQQAKETSTLHLINNDMPRFANTRRQSRECTLHMLYAFDNCSMDEKAVFECFDPLYLRLISLFHQNYVTLHLKS